MILLMCIIAFHSFRRLSDVRSEVVDLTEYLIPIADIITDVDVHVLTQRIHLERLLRFKEDLTINRTRIENERQDFMKRSEKVHQELSTAVTLIMTAVKNAIDPTDQDMLSGLLPRLKKVKVEHQELYNHALTMIPSVESGQIKDAKLHEAKLIKEMDDYYHEVEEIRHDLQKLTQRAALTTIRHQRSVLRVNFVVTGIATLLAVFLALTLTRKMVRPLRELQQAMAAVGAGNLSSPVKIASLDEIGQIADSFCHMVDELVVKEKIKATFGKYVDPRVVENLLEVSGGPEIGGEKQVMTVVFCDMPGFERTTEGLNPDDFLMLLNQYLSIVSEPVSAHHGVIDKFMDTTVMSFWGPPFTDPEEHGIMACEAVLGQLSCLNTIQALIQQHSEKGVDLSYLDFRVGVATGPLIVGNMGSEQSKSYTVLGDTVNIASRLKGAAKQYGVRVLMAGDTWNITRDKMVSREIDLIQVIGKEEPVRIYELLGKANQLSQEVMDLKKTFEEGLAAYRNRDWDAAMAHFTSCLNLKADDKPSMIYQERIRQLQAKPPSTKWIPMWKLTKK